MNKQYKQDFIRAGQLAKEVRAHGKSLIKTGASYNSIIAAVNKKIFELGAIPAFPPQIALNNVAAHYLPEPGQDIILSNEVVKLDIGVCFNGAIGDCAVTVDLSGKYQNLVDAAEAALLAAEKSIKVGQPVREIGKIIETTITSFGLNPVRNLCGHGLGYYKIHTNPSIPNYADQSRALIKPGMTFAIEPFVTNGKGLIYDAGQARIFSFVAPKAVHSDAARALLIRIKELKGLPFAIHDLINQEWSATKVLAALNELMALGAVAGYGALLEESGGFVAQAENSVLVDEKGHVFVTTR